jgi:tRNA pseudouridine38-40 synthase
MERNVVFKIAYDGSKFYGSQKQPNKITVQGFMEEILSAMMKKNIKTTFASRTDRGVHAFSQYLSFKIDNPIELRKFYTLNKRLKYVKIRKVYEAPNDFNPRFDCEKKTYMYVIKNSKSVTPFFSDYFWHIPEKLDMDAMKEAASYFIGEHNFIGFCKKREEDENTIRRIEKIKMVTGNNFIKIFITGNAFLYNMIRFMTYALVEIGKKKKSPQFIKNMLLLSDNNELNRNVAGGKALPGGLYLTKIYYGAKVLKPAKEEKTR